MTRRAQQKNIKKAYAAGQAGPIPFVFGKASSADRVAVFSLARLLATTGAETEGEETLARRAIAEAGHELGHVFNLRHRSQRDCVIWLSTTPAETDC